MTEQAKGERIGKEDREEEGIVTEMKEGGREDSEGDGRGRGQGRE